MRVTEKSYSVLSIRVNGRVCVSVSERPNVCVGESTETPLIQLKIRTCAM